jgi:hypothetical protein
MKKRTLLFSLTFAAVVAAMTVIGRPICSAVASNGIEYTEEEELVIVPVEYIESTGTQWIDLGIVLNTDIDFYIDFQATAKQSWGYYLFGGQKINYQYYYGYNMYVVPSGPPKGMPSPQLGRNIFQKIGDVFTLASSTFTYTGDYVEDTVPCYLFARYGLTKSLMARIYSAQIGDLDLIPVRFTNSHGEDEGAMYDIVTGKLFRNQGSGAFLIGLDL